MDVLWEMTAELMPESCTEWEGGGCAVVRANSAGIGQYDRRPEQPKSALHGTKSSCVVKRRGRPGAGGVEQLCLEPPQQPETKEPG